MCDMTFAQAKAADAGGFDDLSDDCGDENYACMAGLIHIFDVARSYM